jgi:hypothetical protein
MRFLHKSVLLVIACFVVISAVGAVRSRAEVPFDLRKLDDDHGKVEVADIDNDGHNDVVKRASGGESLVWYKYGKRSSPFRGKPLRGKFTKHVIFKNKRFRGDRVALADFDKDGDVDLATGLEENDGYYVVWLENPLPDGSPAKSDSWKIRRVGVQDGYMKDMAAADFDGDGKLDIVTRAHTKTALYFQQNPTTWHRAKAIKHASHEGMDVGDLDRDGDPDIILNGFWLETPNDAKKGTYKKHTFDKKWFTPIDKSWRDNNAAIKVADINGDNLPDILISHSELPGFPVSIYAASSTKNVRADRWKEIQVAERFDFCQTLDAADVDNDGDLDILAAKFERDHQSDRWRNKPPYPVVIFYNTDGKGGKWSRQKLSDDSMYAGVLGDVGSDGDIDVVGPRSYWTGPIRMWESKLSDNSLALDRFKYIQIDDARDKRYFGLAFADLTGDGYQEIVAGKWLYRNPGGDMTGRWDRIELDEHIDALLTLDVDGDEYGDVIGLKPNEQYWYEARNRQGSDCKKVKIGALPINDHGISTQYYGLGQIVPGGKPELILAEYYVEIPDSPERGNWPAVKYSSEGRGYAAGDVDGDGLVDIAGSYHIQGQGKVPGTSNVQWWCSMMCWWKNPGDSSGDWRCFDVGKATHADRYELADINGDGRLDLVTTEERYPGHAPNASCYWFEQPADPTSDTWKRHLVVTQFSMNNLDVADMDRDGDVDIITCEHSMPYKGKPAPGKERLQIWENDGRGTFTKHGVHPGKESHLGAQVTDLDGDGDLDIVSIAWREFQYLHVWRNDARRK